MRPEEGKEEQGHRSSCLGVVKGGGEAIGRARAVATRSLYILKIMYGL